jgi:hypothetical protein
MLHAVSNGNRHILASRLSPPETSVRLELPPGFVTICHQIRIFGADTRDNFIKEPLGEIGDRLLKCERLELKWCHFSNRFTNQFEAMNGLSVGLSASLSIGLH